MDYECVCDGDPPEFYHAEVRRARKPHKCDECSGSILRGEKYEHVRGKWDGWVNNFNTCERCYDLRIWVKNNVPCACIMHGGQDEANDDAVESALWRAPAETAGLRFGYLRRKVMRSKFNLAQLDAHPM